LAAALVPSLGAFESAKSLDLMLKRTTDDMTTIPTLRHLKDLLGSLEARSHRCGFADSVVGWQILLRKEVLPCILSKGRRQRGGPNITPIGDLEKLLLDSTPSPEAIAGLVDVFRQVARMGPATVLGATIRVSAAAPWVLAFAQWCVEPPSLVVGEKEILQQPGSRLKVIISGAADDIGKPFEVTIHHQLENLTRLLGSPSRNSTTGMVTVESYGAWLLRQLSFGDGMLRILREALECAIPQLLGKIKCGRFTQLGQDAGSGQWLGSTDNLKDRCRLYPLPDIRCIADICATILALEDPIQFASLDDITLVAELPLVSRHLGSLAEKCPCEQCCMSTKRSTRRDLLSNNRCYKKDFFDSFSFLVVDILALSLFDSASPLLVKLSLDRESSSKPVNRAISKVITTGRTFSGFDHMHLIASARNMAGYGPLDDEDRSLIITSSKGQVIYPTVFDTFRIEKQGYLKLSCFPGVLRYQDDTYDVVSHPDWVDGQHSGHGYLSPFMFPTQVFGPLKLPGDFSVSWKISVQDNRRIQAGLTLRSKANSPPAIELDPMALLRGLKNALLVESCPHDHRAQLISADQFASYCSPWDDHGEGDGSTSQVDVVAVDGADDLRCFTLASLPVRGASCVLRRNACLACCLNVCRDNGVHTLIL
jgi:hypothetical protein